MAYDPFSSPFFNNLGAVQQRGTLLNLEIQGGAAGITVAGLAPLFVNGLSTGISGATAETKIVIAPGYNAEFIGAQREADVARVVGVKVSGENVSLPPYGGTDIDVEGPNGDLISVGGPSKAANLGSYGRSLHIYQQLAALRGVTAQAYLAEGTPQSVINLAIKILGDANVHLF